MGEGFEFSNEVRTGLGGDDRFIVQSFGVNDYILSMII